MSTGIIFDYMQDAKDFIVENAILPPRKIPGKDEIIFVAKSPRPDGLSVDMDDLEAAIKKLGGNPTRNADQDIAVTGRKFLMIFASWAKRDSRFRFTDFERYGASRRTR